jgi:hypothetical protein
LTKPSSQEQSHANMLARTKHRYDKAEKVNLDRHTQKTTRETQKTDTAVARAAQAATNVQMAQNGGHFPNPRGVDLKWVSCCCSRSLLFFVTNNYYCGHYLIKGYGNNADYEHFASAYPHANGLHPSSGQEVASLASWLATQHLQSHR